MTGTTWNDGEDWESELSRPDGFPLVAMLVGSGVIVLVAALIFNLFDIDVAGHRIAPLCLAILGAGAVFAAAWLLTLRHASLGWNVLAGGVFAGVALMTVVVALAGAAIGTQADAQMVRSIRIDATGQPVLPPGAKAGPITAATMDFMRQALAERHRRIDLVHNLGLDRLANASAIMRQPALVRDCGRFARSGAAVDAIDQSLLAKAQAYRTRLSGIIRDSGMRDAMLKGFDESIGSGAADMKDANQLSHRLLDQAGPLCTLLSARHWKPMGSLFMFTTQRDLAAFKRLIDPWNGLIREAQAIEARQQERMRDSGVIDDRSRL